MIHISYIFQCSNLDGLLSALQQNRGNLCAVGCEENHLRRPEQHNTILEYVQLHMCITYPPLFWELYFGVFQFNPSKLHSCLLLDTNISQYDAPSIGRKKSRIPPMSTVMKIALLGMLVHCSCQNVSFATLTLVTCATNDIPVFCGRR